MKRCFRNSPLPQVVLVVGCSTLMLAAQLTAQTFTTLHSFTFDDGANPSAKVILSDNVLYGTTFEGGSSHVGTVFSVKTDGTGFTNLHNFTAASTSYLTNGDGSNPWSGLTLADNTLYGTANGLGPGSWGTVFSLHTDGTGFTTLYGFAGGTDGGNPWGTLTLSSNTLYGTDAGGSLGNGTVFAVNTDGTGFRTLHTFTAPYSNNGTNSDGDALYAGLILWSNTLYGTARGGGSSGLGTVFAVNTDGSSFTNLHSFTGSDGASPQASLILSGSTLYGTTYFGGTSDNGTLFKLNTDGTGFTTLYSFSATFGPAAGYVYTNRDGANPSAELFLSGSVLYGTTLLGGTSGNGTVFAINTDGTGFKILYNFTAFPLIGPQTNSDGAHPNAVILSSGTLYGTSSGGGTSGNGTVFSIALLASPPQLTITPAQGNVILTWPTDAASFTLQSTTNLASPIWTTNLPTAVVINGQYTVTNRISGTQQFFRLSQ